MLRKNPRPEARRAERAHDYLSFTPDFSYSNFPNCLSAAVAHPPRWGRLRGRWRWKDSFSDNAFTLPYHHFTTPALPSLSSSSFPPRPTVVSSRIRIQRIIYMYTYILCVLHTHIYICIYKRDYAIMFRRVPSYCYYYYYYYDYIRRAIHPVVVVADIVEDEEKCRRRDCRGEERVKMVIRI